MIDRWWLPAGLGGVEQLVRAALSRTWLFSVLCVVRCMWLLLHPYRIVLFVVCEVERRCATLVRVWRAIGACDPSLGG